MAVNAERESSKPSSGEFEQVVSVAYPPLEGAAECAYELVLPHPNCGMPLLAMPMILHLMTLRVLFGPNTKMRVVKATGGWSFTSNSSENNANDTSVMGLVERGLADSTDGRMELKYSRSQRHVHYTKPFKFDPTTYMYRYHADQRKYLDIQMLFRQPGGVWTIILVTTTVKIAIKAVANYFRDQRSGVMIFSELYVRFRLICWLVVGILLAVLSSYLCIIFSRSEPAPDPIQGLQDLIDGIFNHEYTLFVDSQIYSNITLQFDREGRKAWPSAQVTINSDSTEFMERTFASRLDRISVIRVGSSGSMLPTMAQNCFFKSRNFPQIPPSQHVMYYRQNWTTPAQFQPPTLPQLFLIRRFSLDIQAEMYPPTLKSECPSAQDPTYSLAFEQIWGAFLAVLLAFAIAIGLFALEMASEHFNSLWEFWKTSIRLRIV